MNLIPVLKIPAAGCSVLVFFFLEKWESNKNRNTVGVFLNHLRFFQDFFLIGDVIQNYWYHCTTSRARLYAEKFLVSSMKIGIRKWPFSLKENILFFDVSKSIWQNKIFVIGKKLYWFWNICLAIFGSLSWVKCRRTFSGTVQTEIRVILYFNRCMYFTN